MKKTASKSSDLGFSFTSIQNKEQIFLRVFRGKRPLRKFAAEGVLEKLNLCKNQLCVFAFGRFINQRDEEAHGQKRGSDIKRLRLKHFKDVGAD